MFTDLLKDNSYVKKALVTGILRVAKESIFSGLNNLEVDTILGYNFSDKFGFTLEEVDKLVKYFNANEDMKDIENWYNGYIFGEEIIYNPWSVLNYLNNRKDGFIPYWINSSANDLIKRFALNNLSYFDVSGREPEKVYHAFVLGMLVSLSENYEVKSNKESGFGRYDVMIIPKDTSKYGIIIEFKKIDELSKESIEEATEKALKQIEDKKYESELLERGIKNIIKLAIVFKNKEVEITEG